MPESELKDMHNLQRGWMQSLEGAEAKYMKVAERHNSFIVAVDDTSNHWRQMQLSQDTLLQLSIDRLSDRFERLSRRHLFQLKELRSFLEANDVWLLRIETESATRRTVRGSWDARTTQFRTKFDQILVAQSEFETLIPDYDKLSQRIPGMADPVAEAPVVAPPLRNAVTPAITPAPVERQ